MTLFDIFYQHTEWWRNPDLGNDTQGKYGEVLKEMEECALDYARSIKDTGERWKRVIENETRELCRPNHYSWNLKGDKKEWHDVVVSHFLIKIRKAIEHCYGYNFKELPDSIRRQYGIEIFKPQQKHTEASQQPNVGNDGELAGNGNENVPEGEKDKLPTIYDDGIDKKKEQMVLYNAINKGWMELKDNTYSWKKNKSYLALMCGMLYWNDTIGEDKGGTTDYSGEYPTVLKKSTHRFKYKSKGTEKTSINIQKLFGGANVSNLRSQLFRESENIELPGNIPEWNDILNLFPKD